MLPWLLWCRWTFYLLNSAPNCSFYIFVCSPSIRRLAPVERRSCDLRCAAQINNPRDKIINPRADAMPNVLRSVFAVGHILMLIRPAWGPNARAICLTNPDRNWTNVWLEVVQTETLCLRSGVSGCHEEGFWFITAVERNDWLNKRAYDWRIS